MSDCVRSNHECSGRIVFLALPLAWLLTVGGASSATIQDAQALFFQGQYEACQEMAQFEVDRGTWNEHWPQILIEVFLETGRYDQAEQVYQDALRRYGNRIKLRLLGYRLYQALGKAEQAEAELDRALRLIRAAPWRYSSAENRVAVGRILLLQDQDPRQVLEAIYDTVRQRYPSFAETYSAEAELALSKNDYAVAAKAAEAAARYQPENPYVFYLQAEALVHSDLNAAFQSIQKALEINPRHVPSLLFQVDRLISAEQYQQASELLTEVLSVNLHQSDAWAYHAIIAHLQGHFDGEQRLRAAALHWWQDNHHVPHLIGRKLSQSYRFREGAEYQRQALEWKPDFLAARIQLAQDLLRLGKVDEGWENALSVQKTDPYDVVAFNLSQLKDQMDRFEELRSDHFIVRMDRREADVYGDRVIRLLEEAHASLTEKYDVELVEPTQVEIFPEQRDFAVRTFGIPGASGYLGVCFGSVVTANSPASQGPVPTNWQSVLWHEFAHVVTLSKTENRMPRWLSEGISVYEERVRDAAWGQSMNPRYREMILSGEMTPVSQLSAAFLRPPSAEYLQFAYFESSLVVEFLIEQHGFDTLLRILDDLAIGMRMNQALERSVGNAMYLDEAFESFARMRAEELAAEADFSEVAIGPGVELRQLEQLRSQSPNNYQLLHALADRYADEGNRTEAIEVLRHLRELFPQDTSSGNATVKLARLYQDSEPQRETELLREYIKLDANALDAYRRLASLAREQADWPRLAEQAENILAVNPLLAEPHRWLAEAAGRLGDAEREVQARRALIEMDPVDPAAAYFALAECEYRNDKWEAAKRHVLMALELAPRYLEAQGLLLILTGHRDSQETDVTDSQASSSQASSSQASSP